MPAIGCFFSRALFSFWSESTEPNFLVNMEYGMGIMDPTVEQEKTKKKMRNGEHLGSHLRAS